MPPALGIVGSIVLAAVDVLLMVVLFVMAMAENCDSDNGVPSWQCNDTLEFVLVLGIPVVALASGAVLVRALSRR